MTNFELVASDPESLALWLRGGRLDCDLCPCEYGCTQRCLTECVGCYDLILNWLKAEVDDGQDKDE